MSGVEPFQFDLTYPPGDEPTESEKDEGEDHPQECTSGVRTDNTKWCICGECISMLKELNQKFDHSGWCPVLLSYNPGQK